jgi:hypothetical protein
VQGYRALTLAPHTATLGKAGSKTFVLRLSRSFIKALEKQKSVGLTLVVSGTAKATHKTQTIKRGVTFRR